MYARIKQSGPRQYLQLVEGRREGDKVRQRVIATLGRIDQLQDGALDALIAGLQRVAGRQSGHRVHRPEVDRSAPGWQ